MPYLILLLFLSFVPEATPPVPPVTPPADPVTLPADPVTWLGDTTHDFGDIPRDRDAIHEFRYRNDTGRPLTIDNVRMGCGCTGSDWTERPIQPDSIGVLRVTYDAANTGYFRKYVKVYFSGERRAQKLWLEGFVEPNG